MGQNVSCCGNQDLNGGEIDTTNTGATQNLLDLKKNGQEKHVVKI
jgi:hypothetical protein